MKQVLGKLYKKPILSQQFHINKHIITLGISVHATITIIFMCLCACVRVRALCLLFLHLTAAGFDLGSLKLLGIVWVGDWGEWKKRQIADMSSMANPIFLYFQARTAHFTKFFADFSLSRIDETISTASSLEITSHTWWFKAHKLTKKKKI